MKFIKNNFIVILLAIVTLGLLVALFQRDKLYSYLSDQIQQQGNTSAIHDIEKFIRTEYNYAENQKDYDFTFLEFGSSGCSKCKQMEPVLEAIENSDQVKVNVEFIHILHVGNQELMKYYGISAVPVQVLLNKSGKEFYRHNGAITARELENIMIENTASISK